MHNNLDQLEKTLFAVKGSFTPEQFGVFLNMFSYEVEENYLVVFHENFHHWQYVFTPYGHVNWGCNRSVSSEIINLWITATKNCPSKRIIPAADIIPCTDLNQASCIAQIMMQDLAQQIASLRERSIPTTLLQKVLPIAVDEICPIIDLDECAYRLNGIDILEGWAKFQEACLAFLSEGKSFIETIDKQKLRPEYYSALNYFIERVGAHRIIEFPVACELSLLTGKLCIFDESNEWKQFHPAWRFLRIVDVLNQLSPEEQLSYDIVKTSYIDYSERILQKCGFESWNEAWVEAEAYADQKDLNIPNDMKKAIDFKKSFPWALAFPFLDFDVLQEMCSFHPYYYVTSDKSNYTVNSNALANEVAFETHYQAFSHQICGHMSKRCLDRGKLQCGYSYYGLQCQYMKNGLCDGHVDNNSILPEIVLDENENVVEGCDFQLFLSLMDISIKDINITDIAKRIDSASLTADIKRLRS